MNQTPLDRIAEALNDVPIRQEEGVNVYLGLATRIEMADVALSVIRPEMERLRRRIAELEGVQPAVVLPAKFITDAMTNVPDELPPDFA